MNKTLAVKMLKAARVLIENYEYEYVCNALHNRKLCESLPRELLPYYDNTRSELLQWITLQLRGGHTFVGYYMAEGILPIRPNRELRIEWITNMIRAILLNEPLDTNPIDTLKFIDSYEKINKAKELNHGN